MMPKHSFSRQLALKLFFIFGCAPAFLISVPYRASAQHTETGGGGPLAESLPMAEAHQRGTFDCRLPVRPDFATPQVVRQRFDTRRIRLVGETIDPSEEAFHIFCPPNYEPLEPADQIRPTIESSRAETDTETLPWGVLIWISPSPTGYVPRGYERVLAERKLIWISIHNNGNNRETLERFGLTLCAAYNAQLLYDVDPERIYLAGLSGGGRSTSMLATVYADVFRGGMPVVGCNFYRTLEVPSNPGRAWGASTPPSSAMARLAKNQPLIIVTGGDDYNREQCEVFADAYQGDGYRMVTYVEHEGMGHTYQSPEQFAETLALLDERPELRPQEETRQTAAQARLDAALERLQINSEQGMTMLRSLGRSAVDTPAGRRARYLLARMEFAEASLEP